MKNWQGIPTTRLTLGDEVIVQEIIKHWCFVSVNSKPDHPPGRPRGFALSSCPWGRVFAPLSCPGGCPGGLESK